MERVTDEESAGSGWFWNEQVGSYRPQGAMYCRECQVSKFEWRTYYLDSTCNLTGNGLCFSIQALVYDYDHVCPWTGTAIGKGNMLPFKIFVFSVNVLCYLSIGLVVWQIMDKKVIWDIYYNKCRCKGGRRILQFSSWENYPPMFSFGRDQFIRNSILHVTALLWCTVSFRKSVTTK